MQTAYRSARTLIVLGEKTVRIRDRQAMPCAFPLRPGQGGTIWTR